MIKRKRGYRVILPFRLNPGDVLYMFCTCSVDVLYLKRDRTSTANLPKYYRIIPYVPALQRRINGHKMRRDRFNKDTVSFFLSGNLNGVYLNTFTMPLMMIGWPSASFL